jgi:hypothetical protein
VTPELRYTAEERSVDAASADLLRLWGSNLASAGDDLPAKLDWFYRAAPAGPGRALVLLADDGTGSRVVGCQGIGFRRVLCGGRVLRAALVADLAVDAAHRTLMPALVLVRSTRQAATGAADFQYGFPNAKAVGVFRRVGYLPLGTMSRRVRVLRFAPYVARRVGVRLVARLGGALLDGAAAVARAPARLRAAADYRLSFLLGPDARFDALFDEARARHPVVADRGQDFLRWRFFARGDGAELAALTRRGDGALRAYAVVTRRDGVGHLCDFLAASDRDLSALLSLLATALRARGCTSASVRFLGAPATDELLERCGFGLRDADRAVVIDPGGDAELGTLLGDPGNHHLTDADEDN